MKTMAKESKIVKALKPSKKKVIILIALAIATTGVVFKIRSAKTAMSDMVQTNVDEVTKGDVEIAITGSAAIEPKERYEIISMVSGDIISAQFNVGDVVKEGDVLYQFDTSSTDVNMEKQKLSLQQSAINYNNAKKKSDDLVAKATCDGVISGLDVKNGDNLTVNQQLASINNSRVLKVILPFNESQISHIWIGASANITSSINMGGIAGKVISVASNPTAYSDGSKLYDVTINFENPGAIVAGQSVGGEINGMISPGSGLVEYSEKGVLKTDTDGKVSKIYHANGDFVRSGDTILTLTSDSVSNNIENSSIAYKNAQLSLKEQEDRLDDYSITSPISGTVITKTAKAGDTIDKSNSTTVLMVVADISSLKFNLEIDELDVTKAKEGQIVKITCDALPSETYYGAISQVSVEGTATNGVTTYKAEVIINEPGNLRPSMNIDASVIVEAVTNVLRIPTSDMKTSMGHSYVYVKDEIDNKNINKNKKTTKKKTDNKKINMEKASDKPQAPEGYTTVEITTGISGDDFTEVLSGLSEGDVIYGQTVSTSNKGMAAMMGGGMNGGMSMEMGGGHDTETSPADSKNGANTSGRG